MKQLNGSMILKIGKIQKDLDDLREKAPEAAKEISQLAKDVATVINAWLELPDNNGLLLVPMMNSHSKTITERRK